MIDDLTAVADNGQGLNMDVDSWYRGTYFIEDESGRVKIGSSVDVRERIGQLQIGNAEHLTLIAVIDMSEKALHQHYNDSQIRGEWFDPQLDPWLNLLVQVLKRKWKRHMDQLIGILKSEGKNPYISPYNTITFNY